LQVNIFHHSLTLLSFHIYPSALSALHIGTVTNPTMPLNILIIGAGCAGPALALLFQRSNPGHIITVLERFNGLRTGGQQLDIKAQGIHIADKMGVL
jgi:hypothetical protein